MRRGFLNKPKPKGSPAHSALSSDNQKGTAINAKLPNSAAENTDAPGKTEQSTPLESIDNKIHAGKPELDGLMFVTIPPRRPNCPNDPDGHAELIFPSYGNALSKVLGAPGHPKPVAKTPQKNYIIKPVENMGLGMFATCNVQKGDLLLAERPFFCIPEIMINNVFDASLTKGLGLAEMTTLVRDLAEKRLEHMAARMSKADRDAVLQLGNSHDDEEDTGPLLGRLRTNCYGINSKLWDDVHANMSNGNGGTTKMGYNVTGRDSSRINHSCMPNVMHLFDLASFAIQFFATRSIKSGEQIFYSYSEQRNSLVERRAVLSRYRIVCACYACTHSSPELEAFRRDFPKKIEVLKKACNDLLGGIAMIGPDGVAQRPGPEKPFDAITQGAKLKKEILEPMLRLQTEIEREGLAMQKEMLDVWMVLSRAWRKVPGQYAAMKDQEACKEMGILLKLYGYVH